MDSHSHSHSHPHPAGNVDPDLEEAIHHDHILRSFSSYRYAHIQANNLRRQSYASLDEYHQKYYLSNQIELLNVGDLYCITLLYYILMLCADFPDACFP